MDKQKIEEMARIIAFELCPNRAIHKKWGEEAQCYSDNNFAECKEIKNVVDKLYNVGHRKIPELSKDTVLTANDIAELLTIVAKDTRKETAEKFAERLKEYLREKSFLDFDGDDTDGYIIYTYLDECYGKIDEICKELTEGKE